MKKGIRKRFRVACIGMGVGPLLVIGFVISWQSYKTQLEQAKIYQREVNRTAAVEVASFINTAEDHLRAMFRFQDLKSLNPSRQSEILSQILTHKDALYNNLFYDIALIDCNEEILSYNSLYGNTSRRHYSERFRVNDFLSEVCSNSTYYGPIDFEEDTGEPFMTIAVPITEVRSGHVWGTIAAHIRFKVIWDIVGGIEIGEKGLVYLVDQQNRVVAHPDPSVVLLGTRFQVPAKDGIQKGSAGNTVILVSDFIFIGQQTLRLVTERPVKEAMSLTFAMLWQIFIIIFLALAVSLLFGLIAERQIVKPVELLAKMALEIGAGDLTQQVKYDQKNEIGDLAGAFNIMTGKLQKTISSMEQQIRERKQAMKELEVANTELDDFAYIVSHDLKAPLRGISQLSGWIVKDYGDVIDEAGKELIDLLMKRVVRMHRLIEGVLQYSKVGRIRETNQSVDLNSLVTEVVDTVDPPDNIQVTVEERLPTVRGEMIRLKQVFQNLIDNAVKFMDKKDGEINISCVNDGTHWKISVSDNGPGIEKIYHEKIFKIFQTLSTRNETNSTGVGLSLVKKIVESAGGSIWVESDRAKGTTFFFTLPKNG